MNKFKIYYRVDTEDYICYDECIIDSQCYDVYDFVLEHKEELERIQSRNTIISISLL